MPGCGLSLRLVFGSLGLVMGHPSRLSFEHDVVVALYLPWCGYLAAHDWVEPQLYADHLKCVSRGPNLLLPAALFTTGCVLLVGQEPAPSKCVLLSTSRAVKMFWRIWCCPWREISGLSSLMSGILKVIWILLFEVGRQGSFGYFTVGTYLCPSDFYG